MFIWIYRKCLFFKQEVLLLDICLIFFVFFNKKPAYELRISDWSSYVCSSDLEGALVFNNVMLTAILGIVLFWTLYPLVAEAMGAKVSVGPPYFNPMGALFAVPMLAILAVGPLLRWRRDNFSRVG